MATLDREGRTTPRLSSEILDRLPPQNLEAERGVLGSLLLDAQLIDEVVMLVDSEDFYARSNQLLFEHLLVMHNEGLRVDMTLLVERLKKENDLELIGGLAYLGEVMQSVPTAANAANYAQIVRDKATLRSLIHASTEILRDAYDQSLEAREMLSARKRRSSASWKTREPATWRRCKTCCTKHWSESTPG